MGTSLTIWDSTDSPKTFEKFVRKIGFGTRVVGVGARKTQIPVLPDFQFTIAERGAMSGGKLVNATKHGLGIRDPEESQVLMQRLQIEFGLDVGNVQQRFHFRSERQFSSMLSIIEGLHSEMIARKK